MIPLLCPYVELELRSFLPESSSLSLEALWDFFPVQDEQKMAFLFERVLEIQSLHWSRIQADHFQDKYFLLNCFRLPSEVTTLFPREVSHRGTSHHPAQPWRSYLTVLARVPSLRHGESTYCSSSSHPQRCESQHFG